MLQYAPLDEGFGTMRAAPDTSGSHRRRRRREEADEPELPTPERIMMPVEQQQPPVPQKHPQSVIDAIHPDVMRILPYACLLFFVVIIMMVVEMKGTLIQIKDLLARERMFHTRPFMRSP